MVPNNHRPLRKILIIRKIFEVETTVRLVRKIFPQRSTSDEIEQFGFNEKSMPLMLIARLY